MDNRSEIPGVYIYRLAQEMEISLAATQSFNMYPEINGEVIAWMALDPIKNYWVIRAFDIAIDNRTELVWGLSAPSALSISDTYLAYFDLSVTVFGWRVYKKLLFGTETAPAIPPSGMNVRTGKGGGLPGQFSHRRQRQLEHLRLDAGKSAGEDHR